MQGHTATCVRITLNDHPSPQFPVSHYDTTMAHKTTLFVVSL